MSSEPFETLEAQGYPSVTQLSVFIDDRVGQLMRLTRVFAGTDIRILGLMVVNSVDCAIVRIIVDDPDAAGRVLADHSFPYKETEMLVVCLPHGKRGLMDVWSAMLGAEIDVHYTYALLGDPHGVGRCCTGPLDDLRDEPELPRLFKVEDLEVGEVNGQHFFSMAFVEGENLSQRLQRGLMAPWTRTLHAS